MSHLCGPRWVQGPERLGVREWVWNRRVIEINKWLTSLQERCGAIRANVEADPETIQAR